MARCCQENLLNQQKRKPPKPKKKQAGTRESSSPPCHHHHTFTHTHAHTRAGPSRSHTHTHTHTHSHTHSHTRSHTHTHTHSLSLSPSLSPSLSLAVCADCTLSIHNECVMAGNAHVVHFADFSKAMSSSISQGREEEAFEQQEALPGCCVFVVCLCLFSLSLPHPIVHSKQTRLPLHQPLTRSLPPTHRLLLLLASFLAASTSSPPPLFVFFFLVSTTQPCLPRTWNSASLCSTRRAQAPSARTLLPLLSERWARPPPQRSLRCECASVCVWMGVGVDGR